MQYTDFSARLTGLLVAVTGAALVGRGLLVAPPEGFLGIGVVGPTGLTPLRTAAAAAGIAFVIAGLAVGVGRGRALAVSVGSLAVAATIVSLAVGSGSPTGVLGVGVAALALLLSGAWTGRDRRVNQ